MVRNLLTRILMLILIMGTIWACKPDLLPGEDDAIGFKASPALALKLGYLNYTIEELLDELDSTVEIATGQDGTVILSYKDTIEEISIKDEVEIEDQQFSDDLFLQIPTALKGFPIPGGTEIIFGDVYEETLEFNNGEIVDSVNINSGQLRVTASTFGLPVAIDSILFEFHSLVDNGTIFTVLIEDLGATPRSIDRALDGYTLLLSEGNQINSLSFEVTAKIISDGSPISEAMGVDFTIDIVNLDYNGIFGYVGQQTTSFDTDPLEIDFFEEIEADRTYFAEPSIQLNLITDAGLYAAFQIDEIVGTDINGVRTFLTGDVVTNPFKFNGPDYTQIGEEVTNSFAIDHTNSNIDDLISARPARIELSSSILTNPDDQTDSLDFILADSKFNANYDIQLPLAFTIDNLNRLESIDFGDENDDGESDIDLTIEQLDLIIEAVNSIPLAVEARIVFYDSVRNQEIYDVFSGFEPLVAGATTDAQGFSIGEAINEVTASIAQEDFDNINDFADKILVYIRLNSSELSQDKVVRIQQENEVNLDLKFIGKGSIEESF